MAKYKIQKLNVDKEPLTYINTTDITGIIDKSAFLKQWAADLTIDYIEDTKKQYTEENKECLYYHVEWNDFDKILENARNAHKQKLEETRDIGSELHYIVDLFISGYNTGLNNDVKHFTKDYDADIKAMFMAFYDWQKENVKEFLESEKVVCNQELCYAGKLDFIYIDMNNNIVCCDLKTSNDIYKEHQLQVVAYKMARESMYDKIPGEDYKNDVFDFEFKDATYKIYKEFNGQKWHEKINYPKIKIDKCGILNINRNAELNYKEVKDVDNLQNAFKGLLSFYYAYANRRLNNYRAKERK